MNHRVGETKDTDKGLNAFRSPFMLCYLRAMITKQENNMEGAGEAGDKMQFVNFSTVSRYETENSMLFSFLLVKLCHSRIYIMRFDMDS